MKLLSFRIRHFRSIADTGWCQFSPDGVTVLVGQNESGKTSILEAISRTFGTEGISDEDCRIDAPLPEVAFTASVDALPLSEDLPDWAREQFEAISPNIKRATLTFSWKLEGSPEKRIYRKYINIDVEGLEATLEHLLVQLRKEQARKSQEAIELKSSAQTDEFAVPNAEKHETPSDGRDQPNPSDEVNTLTAITEDMVHETILRDAPDISLFEADSGLLPDSVDVITRDDGQAELNGPGSRAAENFLNIAGISLDALVQGDRRFRENMLARANSRISEDFAQFWSQTIGKTAKLQIECVMANYGADVQGKAGRPHFVFWISDGLNKVHPKQRSQGVRWFVSFYLQLKASEKRQQSRIFLLDEPGANLHEKAQGDVLRLINQLKADVPIVYSTHSPYMVEYEKLYRVLAVQRDQDSDDSPTAVISAHKLGAASRDTLSPILSAMGADLSHQQVIAKSDNVILEEMSAFYYLSAFWKLLPRTTSPHFIAATGASNVEPLANMFLGWGLDFIVVTDDDNAGRSAYNSLKRNMFGDDEAIARQNLYKIAGCEGVEDIFSQKDFVTLVLQDPGKSTAESNSNLLRGAGLSKHVLAFKFHIAVAEGKVTWETLDATTRTKIEEVTSEITTRLLAKRSI